MPYFESECEIDIEVDEFINSCSSREIREIIEQEELPPSLLEKVEKETGKSLLSKEA